MKRGKEKQGRKEPVSMKLNGPCGLNSCGCGSKLFTHLLSQKTSRHAQCLKISKKTRTTSYVNTPVASIGITENGQKKLIGRSLLCTTLLLLGRFYRGNGPCSLGALFWELRRIPDWIVFSRFFLLTCCPDPDC